MEADSKDFKDLVMAPVVSDNGEWKDSLLCSRCLTEINTIVIDDSEDHILPLSTNLDNDNELLHLGSRKRKREFMSDGRKGHDDNVVEIIEKEDDPQGMRWKSHSQIAKILKELVSKSNLPKKEESAILDMISVLEKKPNLKPLKEKVVKSDRPHPKPGPEIEQLLRGDWQIEGQARN